MRRASRRTARRTARRVTRRRIRMRRRRMLLAGGMVAIAVAGTGAAIKLSQQDAQRIEQHTGKKPEDLSEAQLEGAIADLDIETYDLTDSDVTALEAEGAPPAPGPESAPPAAAPAAPATTPDYITELERLAELRDKSIITEEEFEAKKRQLLGL